MPIVFVLFFTFAKIGLFTFGGGYAMIALIEDICVTRKKWITHEDMTNITVIAESTPGPVAINCATFVGYKQAGLRGAVAATIGVVLPSFGVIYLISVFLENFLEITFVAKAFAGIRIAVGILILKAAVNLLKKMKKGVFSTIVLVMSCLVMLAVDYFSLRLSTVVLLIAAGVLGVVVSGLKEMTDKKGGTLK